MIHDKINIAHNWERNGLGNKCPWETGCPYGEKKWKSGPYLTSSLRINVAWLKFLNMKRQYHKTFRRQSLKDLNDFGGRQGFL